MTGDLTEVVEGIVHEPTQTEGPGLDLTLQEVYQVTQASHIDFGGGEAKPADRVPVETELRHSDDEYGWFTLEAGQYLISFNETLTDGADEYWLQTREVVRQAGGFHPSLRVRELEPVPLSVGGEGIRLKENARVSTLFEE